MKKFVIILIIILVILSCFTYWYLNNKARINNARVANMKYENYLNEEVYGNSLATVINKAMDNNEKEKVPKNNDGIYIDNEQNSINIEIKFLDNDKTYSMETIFASGIDNFIKYYNQIKFKCVKIDYHKSTNKVKYMLFEQIPQ